VVDVGAGVLEDEALEALEPLDPRDLPLPEPSEGADPSAGGAAESDAPALGGVVLLGAGNAPAVE
jgi:hypothetical protein